MHPLPARSEIPEAEKTKIQKRIQASRALINLIKAMPDNPEPSDISTVAIAATQLAHGDGVEFVDYVSGKWVADKITRDELSEWVKKPRPFRIRLLYWKMKIRGWYWRYIKAPPDYPT